MPELPEVETVRRGLESAWRGREISGVELRREGLRYPFQADLEERLLGARVSAVWRRAKYLLVEFDNGQVMVSHLGMSGKYTLVAGNEMDAKTGSNPMISEDDFIENKHDHVVFHFSDNSYGVYTDHRRFGFIFSIDKEEVDENKFITKIGPEPLRMDGVWGESLWDAKQFAKKIQNRKSPIKTTLLDQQIVAGLGNIYVCEALHRTGIHPEKPANELLTKAGKASKKMIDLVAECQLILKEAILAGGSTLSDFKGVDGSLGYFPHQFGAYGKEGEKCNKCPKGEIHRIVQGGRSTFFCPKCQK